MSAAVDAIPVEILVMIFKNLKGTEAAACRAVCRRWRDAVDFFTDDTWQHLCARDFLNPISTKNVSNLSFQDLYKSLTLWSKVEKAEEKCPIKPVENVTGFIVLNNDTVAVNICDFTDDLQGGNLFNNVIEYYSIQTMTLISRKTYKFSFFCYDENEKLITMMDSVRRIHVIIKSNDKEFVVGDLMEYNKFTLLDTEVYFKNSSDMLCVARMTVVDGEETVELEELHDLEEDVVAFAPAGNDGVNILTDKGNIYCYRNKDFEYCSQLDRYIIYELWDFGFHWSNANIYRWLSSNYSEEQLQITKLKSAVTYNHVVLLGTSRHTVHVYKQPYKENGKLKLYTSKPDRIIDMTKYNDDNTVGGNIYQLDVVEILHGHRLFVLYSSMLFCIDLLHKQLNVPKKRASPHSSRAEPLKRVYMTRSMAKQRKTT